MGIGTNAQHPDEGELTRKLDAVACGVWFTSKGAAIPKMIKYQDKKALSIALLIFMYKIEKRSFIVVFLSMNFAAIQ